MLLTLSQPATTDFGARAAAHDFKPPQLPSNTPRFSPNLIMNENLRSSLPASHTPTMSNQHRGLPPPMGMTLPDPGRPPPPIAPSQPLGSMPPAPTQWQGEGHDLRNWLNTKAEEERRRQEEEKTRQETLRLEQRRVEQSMLRESMQGGVPPHMVPMIFAGIGGANLANFSLEMLQQYTAQLQAGQHQMQESSPEMRRETRSIQQPPAPYPLQSQPAPPHPLQAPPVAPIQPPPPMPTQQPAFSAYQPPSPPGRPRIPAAPSAPRSAAHSALPRLTTGDMQIHQPPTAPSSAHPLQQTQTIQQDQPASSPSIYFHHWVPPTSQAEGKSGNQPQTPIVGPGGSHLSEGEYTSSPRKRKAPGPHQPPPPPSANPTHSSPSFSTTSSGKKAGGAGGSVQHNRSRSNASKEGDSVRHTPSRRDSGAPGTQVEFMMNVDQRRGRDASTMPRSTAPSYPSSPKREYR